MKGKLIFVSFIIAIACLNITCGNKPSEPQYSNIFDPDNSQTSGNPFQLDAKLANGGVTLSWNLIKIDNLGSFKIYRSESEASGFTAIKTTSASDTVYVDTDIQNGLDYWYRVTAADKSGNESSHTNVAAVYIKTEPLLVINGGDEYTSTKLVDLTILAMTAQQMMLSNYADFTDASWEQYNTSKTWTLLIGEGEKNVYLKVKYNTGKESPVVHNPIILDTTPPNAMFSVNPDSGITGETTFQFDPTASSDNLAPSTDIMVRFDWENDSNWDTGWQELGVSSHMYGTGGGDRTVGMEITDGAGWTTDTAVNIFVNTRPATSFTATEDGSNFKLFNFNASTSTDAEDGTNLLYRWDFNGDGEWDTEYISVATAEYEYIVGGKYLPKLSVQDQNYLTSEQAIPINVFFGTVTDIDGNEYQAVKIGDQWWMAENLKVTHYRNGDAIPNVTDGAAWTNLTTGAYCAYNNDNNNVATCGLLYNWYAVNDSRNIAPEGWHVPTDEEWKQLEMYLGMSPSQADFTGSRGTDEGGKLKETGTAHWKSPNTGATNVSGFTALPGGYRHYHTGDFYNIGDYGYWWSASAYDATYAWYHRLYYGYAQAYRFYFNKPYGFSVRCVRD